MSFSKKLSVLGTALLIALIFALPAFAAWQSTPVQSVTFKETIPQNAIVVDGNNAYVAAHDGHRLVVYRWNLTQNQEGITGIWLVDGNLVSGSAGSYPSMALYNYGGYKYVILSYISGSDLMAALFDPKDEKWYVHEVPCAELTNPKYTSVAVGYATSAFTNGATVAAIAVGGDSGVYLATVNMGAVAGSATEANFKSNLNWEVSRITDKKATGVDVFLLPQNANLGRWAGLIYVSYIAGEYGQSGTGLYLAVSKNGKDWSGNNGCIALVDSDPNVVYGADTSLWVGAGYSTSAAIGIAYVTKGGNLLFTSFATGTGWDVIAQLPQVAQSEFKKNVVVFGDVKPCNIDMGVSGLATEATIAIAYFDTRTGTNVGGAWVAYATSANFASSISPWIRNKVDLKGYGAITLIYNSNSYYYSWATTGDLLKLATAAASGLGSWTPDGGRTLANASLFGMGYSVAGTGDYHASFYDAVLRTLNYLKFDSSYTIKDDATTKIVDKPGWFDKKGDAIAVKVTSYLDAGWNTDIDLDSKGEPHIVFTSILSGSASNLDTAIKPATPATVSYVTTTVGGWVNPETVATDLNVRDLDIEITSVGGMKDALHVTWVNAFTSNNGVFYRQKKDTSWQTIRPVYNLPTEVVDGNLDMKVLVLSNGDELIGLAVGLATSSASSVHYAWKEASEQTFSHVFEVQKFNGYNKMCEVALALYNDKATVVYSAPGGRGALSYETDVAQVTVDNGWKGTATEIDDGGCPLCERKDPFVVVDGSDVYVLYKYLDYPTTTKYYFRFGKITEEPDYVKVGTDKVESNPVFANASRMEALMTKSLFFYKGTTGIANAAESEVPPAPEVSVTVNPTSLAFGEVNVGESKVLTVTVTVDNPTASAVNVSVTLSGTGFTVTPESWTVDAGKTGDTKTLNVTFAPTEAKDYSGTLTVTVGTKTATVSLSGTGKSVGGGGGCSASDVGSLGLALLLVGPAILALRKK